MRFRARLAITTVAATLLLSACGSGQPESLKDLQGAIESTGHKCSDPEPQANGSTRVDCGRNISAYWFSGSEAEAVEFDRIEKNMEGMPFDMHSIRGDTWQIHGDEAAVSRVAADMGRVVVSTGSRRALGQG